jgi:hypothetical protein
MANSDEYHYQGRGRNYTSLRLICHYVWTRMWESSGRGYILGIHYSLLFSIQSYKT